MISIYGRRWYSRLWAIHEVTLSKEAILCCGKYEMAWKTFATAMLVFIVALERARPWIGARRFRHSDAEVLIKSWNIVRTRCKYRFLSSETCIVQSSHTGLAMAIPRLTLYDCSDDHDRVYAVLGLDPLFQVHTFHQRLQSKPKAAVCEIGGAIRWQPYMVAFYVGSAMTIIRNLLGFVHEIQGLYTVSSAVAKLLCT